jgi:hypothetical protein
MPQSCPESDPLDKIPATAHIRAGGEAELTYNPMAINLREPDNNGTVTT